MLPVIRLYFELDVWPRWNFFQWIKKVLVLACLGARDSTGIAMSVCLNLILPRHYEAGHGGP